MRIRPLPSRETLMELLSYAPDTGELLWQVKPATSQANLCFNTKYAGKPAGSLSGGRSDGSNRYLLVGIRLDGKYQQYLAHRLIWKMMTGEEPPVQIDHRDGDELNLRWENLRPCSHGQNIQNSKLRKDNKTGYKGVTLRVRGNYRRYRAQIAINKHLIRLGDFKTAEEAAAVRNAAAQTLHREFARSN